MHILAPQVSFSLDCTLKTNTNYLILWILMGMSHYFLIYYRTNDKVVHKVICRFINNENKLWVAALFKTHIIKIIYCETPVLTALSFHKFKQWSDAWAEHLKEVSCETCSSVSGNRTCQQLLNSSICQVLSLLLSAVTGTGTNNNFEIQCAMSHLEAGSVYCYVCPPPPQLIKFMTQLLSLILLSCQPWNNM